MTVSRVSVTVGSGIVQVGDNSKQRYIGIVVREVILGVDTVVEKVSDNDYRSDKHEACKAADSSILGIAR